MGIKLVFESKLYIVEKDQSTLPNVNIRDPSRDKKSSDYICNWVHKPKCF